MTSENSSMNIELQENKKKLIKLFTSTVNNGIKNNRYSQSFNYRNLTLKKTSSFIKNTKINDDDDISLNQHNKALLQIFNRTFSMWEAGKGQKKLYKNLYAFPEFSQEYEKFKNKNLFDIKTDDQIPVNIDENYIDDLDRKSVV